MIEENRKKSLMSAQHLDTFSGIVTHMQGQAGELMSPRYFVELVEAGGAVFWVYCVGPNVWHQMTATIEDPGFSKPPFLQVEFPMGQAALLKVDALLTMAGKSLPSLPVGVYVTPEHNLRLFANRNLATLDASQFDQMTSAINTTIKVYCMSFNDGDPPPTGCWTDYHPSELPSIRPQ